MRVSMNYGGGMGGGMGSGGMGMMEDPSLWEQIISYIDTLPGWLSTIIIAGAVILGAMFVGWIVGQIVGRVIYPNPDKPSVLNKKEKMIYLGVLSLAIVIIVSVAMPKAEDDMAVNGGAGGGMDIVGGAGSGAMDGAMDGDAAIPEGGDAATNPDSSEGSSSDVSSSSSDGDSGSSSSEASSSSSADSESKAPNPPAVATPDVGVSKLPAAQSRVG